MKLLIAFFKDKTREISLYAGTVGIFIVVAFLYNHSYKSFIVI